MKTKTERKKKCLTECRVCLLGLILLSSLLTGISGVDETHVFISSGENVRLSCNNALHDCTSTTWNYNGFRDSATVELIGLGIKKKDTERHERLSLGSALLNIRNILQQKIWIVQWTGVNRDKHQKPNARVYLHVLHVSSSQTEISAGLSVTLFCQLYSYTGGSCDDWIRSERIQLFWGKLAKIRPANMGPAGKLFTIHQGDQSIEEYARDFFGVAHRSPMEKTCLMVVFFGGLAEPFKSLMAYWVPEEVTGGLH
ncbi:hypothetical protein cypCar_00042994 [Cyprinus carpio]|nr:hypothetical protein cypCar_00042994 [Cyprinus carpio]